MIIGRNSIESNTTGALLTGRSCRISDSPFFARSGAAASSLGRTAVKIASATMIPAAMMAPGTDHAFAFYVMILFPTREKPDDRLCLVVHMSAMLMKID